MEKEDILFLSQLTSSIEEAVIKLEESSKNKNYDKFDKIKKIMLEINKKISEIVK